MQIELTGDKKKILLGTKQKLVVKQNVFKYTQVPSTTTLYIHNWKQFAVQHSQQTTRYNDKRTNCMVATEIELAHATNKCFLPD
jgi:hypothetical protein